jgi:DNA-damage-inducible protein J
MTKTATITVRIDPLVKRRAQEVLKQLGLTTTQAVTLYLNQISAEKGLPFHPHIPNAETEQAMQDALDGKDLKTFDNIEDLFKVLDLPDA